ncbi:ABC transporter substrate-binding protein [Alkalihalobacillus sp. LMS39]|uniref:ABC transporter substrate-binding protein n=1 Tax=Alkalihalobacillus sp. LMS39 TaxID=2924032 RepID=UPI001FB38E3C|nr:ABC transporter substrate-binding protein [Alkalihalobacillus sp. LMS39]UOE92409.1 ABC transporter substrate-binding protein [Alkalihalobacillus sp. LMS39]
MKKWLSQLMFVLLAIGLLAGCGADTQQEDAVNVTDAVDNEIVLEEEPERIVSLIPSNTEILFALGAGDKLVGRSDHDNYPPEVEDVEAIGGFEFDVEKIISLQPDIVLAHGSNATAEGLDQIRGADIQVAVVNDANSFEDMYRAINFIAEITNTKEEAEQLISDMEARFAELSEQAAAIPEEERQTVWIEISNELYTTGKDTFMHEMLETIHAENVAGDTSGWPQFSEEQVIAENPDVIIGTYSSWVPDMVDQILNRPGWQDVTAVQEERVHDIDEDIVSRPGPRVVEGVEQLAKFIYPEVFN